MLIKKYFTVDLLLAGLLFVLVLIVLTLSSCKHEPDVFPSNVTNAQNNNGTGNNNNNAASTCDPDTVYFQTQILPLLVSNCAKSGCHSQVDHEDGVIMNNYSNIISTGDVDPGRPGHSKMYEMITETDPDKRMPRDGSLSQAQIDLIYRWIDQGALNNSCSDVCDTNNVTFSSTIFPMIQNSCVGCHSGSTPGGQIDMTTYTGISTVAQNGKLLGAVSHAGGFQPMPRGGNKLSDCNIDQIRIWINNGALNN